MITEKLDWHLNIPTNFQCIKKCINIELVKMVQRVNEIGVCVLRILVQTGWTSKLICDTRVWESTDPRVSWLARLAKSASSGCNLQTLSNI